MITASVMNSEIRRLISKYLEIKHHVFVKNKQMMLDSYARKIVDSLLEETKVENKVENNNK